MIHNVDLAISLALAPQRDLSPYIQSWEQRNRRIGSPSVVTIDDITVSVNAGVFSPDPCLTHSTTMLMRVLPAVKGNSFLDLGTGCGIVALQAVRNGAAKVVATDIQQQAIHNARENAVVHHYFNKIRLIESDVFDQVYERFDIIAANLPFMVTNYVFNHVATETYRRFFAGVKHRLSPNGAAYLTFGSWGDLPTLKEMIAGAGLSWRCVIEERTNESWYVFQLYDRETSFPLLAQ